MTIFGIDPELLGLSLIYSIIPAALTTAHPDFFVIISVPSGVLNLVGVVLLLLGIPL